MRTKTLLVAAALSAAGLATSLAQSNVYSLNVVGYINAAVANVNTLTIGVTNGFNLMSCPLDLDGTGTNNTIYTTIGTNVPNQTRAYAFDAPNATFNFATYSTSSGTWIGNVTAVNKSARPGQGIFLKIPDGVAFSTITFVGNVMVNEFPGAHTGNLITPVGAYYQIISSQVPQSGGMQTVLGYSPANQDRVYQWLPGIQNYGSPHTYSTGTSSWIGGEPSLAVGESVWLLGHAGSTWSRSFSIP